MKKKIKITYIKENDPEFIVDDYDIDDIGKIIKIREENDCN